MSAVQPPAHIADRHDASAAKAINRVARNSAWLVAGQMISKLLTFGYTVALARCLGVASFGNFTLVLSFVMVADIATDFGLTRLIIRDLARDSAHLPRYLGLLLPAKAMLIGIGYLAMIAIVVLMGYRSEVAKLAMLAGLGMLPLGLGTVLDAACHASQRMKWSSLAQISLAITQAIVGSAVLLAGGGVWEAVGVSLLANFAYLVMQIWGSRQLGFRIHWSVDIAAAAALLRQALPYAGVALLAALSMRAEILILGWFGSPTELGNFGVALKFYEAAAFLPVMIASASTPAMSQFHAQSASRLGELYRWTISRVLILTIPAMLVIVVFSHRIIELLFASQYAPAAPLLREIFFVYPLAAIYIVNGSLLLASDHAHRAIGTSFAIVTLQLVLAFILVPAHGAQGAAVSLMITQSAAAIVSTLLVMRWYGLRTGSADTAEVQP